MAPLKKRGGQTKKPPADALPDLLAAALARQDDLILTHETDPDSGVVSIHVMTGKFVSACMLRKLQGQVEAQRDEGSTLLTWRPAGRKKKRQQP